MTMCRILLALFILGTGGRSLSDPLLPETFTRLILENGLSVQIARRPGPGIVNAVLAINLGSKDETLRTSGYVHILEHLLLFGSTRDHHFLKLQEEARLQGIRYNAHTDQDLVIVECQTLPKNLHRCLAFLREKVFALSFSPDELHKEIQVILQEIGTLRDQPDQTGVMTVLQALFQGHPYGRPVTGDPVVITRAAATDLQHFYRAYFTPGNCALSLVGDLDPPRAEASARELFADLPTAKSPTRSFSSPLPLTDPVELEKSMDIQHGHLFIGWLAPALYHPDQLPFNLLVQILGRGTNPLLYQALRQNRGLEANVSLYYYALAHGGALVIHLKTEPHLLADAARATRSFLSRLNRVRFSREDYLLRDRYRAPDLIQNARVLYERNYHRMLEKGLTLARDLAINAVSGQLDSRGAGQSLQDRLQSVDTQVLQDLANRYFVNRHPVVLAITPLPDHETR